MTLDYPAGLVSPRSAATIADLMPAVLGPLGVAGSAPSPDLRLAGRERTVIFVVDGLGMDLLARHAAGAPFLSAHEQHQMPPLAATFLQASVTPRMPPLMAAFPTSTAVSLTSLGTGRLAGEHGIVGYTMFVPEADDVLQCLSWQSYGGGRDLIEVAVPEVLQPLPTLAERAAAAGIPFYVISYEPHEASGLTRAAQRGAGYLPIPWIEDRDRRIELLGAVLTDDGPSVISTYYAGLDMAGHEHGVDSPEWRMQLRAVDELARAIADELFLGCRLIVTGDHGMVDVASGPAGRIDVGVRPALATGLRAFAGDPRMRHLHTEPGERDRVAERWRNELGDDVWIVEREQAIQAGWFGPTVRPEVVGRIGDLLALAVANVGIFDSRIAPAEVALIGHHGSLTSDELLVPMIVVER